MASPLELGIKALKEQRFEEAAGVFEELLKVYPTNETIRTFLAQSYLSSGRKEEARPLFETLLHAQDPRAAEIARRALETIGPLQNRDIICPKCGERVPSERAQAPWCECGWGRRASGERLYIAHLLMFCAKKKLLIEFKRFSDMYSVAKEVRIKHLSDQSTPVDPRLVFRVECGVPFLTSDDLNLVMANVDDKALFRLRRDGEFGAGKLLGWDSMYQLIREVVGDPAMSPDASLRTLLVTYGGISASAMEEAVRACGTESLGAYLVRTGVCSLQDLLVGALGENHVFVPRHREANQIGKILLDARAISEEVLRKALLSQLKKPRPLAKMLRPLVSSPVWKQALQKFDKLPDQGPPRDALGEILYEMGVLSRTDLVQALQESRRTRQALSKVLPELGLVKAEALSEGLARQELKQAARRAGEVKLGELLIELDACTLKQVAVALVRQIQHPQPLGALLVQAGAITPEQLVVALAEQEKRLDALVAERLPAALHPPEGGAPATQNKKRRTREYLPDELGEDEEEAEPKPPRLLLGGLVLVGSALVALLFMQVIPRLRPAPPSPPPMMHAARMAGSAGGAGASSSVEAFSSLNARNVVNVDMDKVLERVEKGDENPLGEGFMGAYKNPLPKDLQQAASQAVERHSTASPSAPTAAGGMPVSKAQVIASSLDDADIGQLVERQREKATSSQTVDMEPQAQASIEALQAATAREPRNAALLGQLGAAQNQGGRYLEAERSLVRAAKLAPQDPQVLNQLGVARFSQGDLPGAVEAFTQLSKLEPGNAQPLVKVGAILKAQGRLPEAKQAFEAALKRDPKEPSSHYHLGVMKKVSDPKKATDHLQTAIKGFGELVAARMVFGEAQKAQGDVKGAFLSLDGALKANTLLADSHMALGKLHLERRELNAAKQQFTLAKQTYQTNAIAHTEKGNALRALKRPKEAMQEWVLATRIAPYYPPPFFQLGLLALSQKKVQEARRFFQRALDADPQGPLSKELKRRLANPTGA